MADPLGPVCASASPGRRPDCSLTLSCPRSLSSTHSPCAAEAAAAVLGCDSRCSHRLLKPRVICSPLIQQSPSPLVLQHSTQGSVKPFSCWHLAFWGQQESVAERTPASETNTLALSIRAGVWQTSECAYKAVFVPSRLPARHCILVFFVLGHIHCRKE